MTNSIFSSTTVESGGPRTQAGAATQRRIAVAQLDIRAGQMSANLAKVRRTIREHRSADLLVFPELVLQGHLYSTAPRHEIIRAIQRTRSDVNKKMYAYARRFDCRLIFGELFQEGERLYNSAAYIDRTHIQRYHKTHVHWTEPFDPGDTLPVFGQGSDALGILICFDSAFPEAARVLALSGAQTIVVIAAIPRQFPWRYVLRRLTSIALDNQVFVIFANRAGRDYYGNSIVIDPYGDVVACAGEEEKVLQATIDLEAVTTWRNNEPLSRHRRPELYRSLTVR